MSSFGTPKTHKNHSGPVTELALFRLKSPPISNSTNINSVTLENLAHAAESQFRYSSYPVTLLHCHEDPSLVYLVGGWSSISQHMENWIPSERNQELLDLLSPDVDVEWMFHLGLDPTEVQKTLNQDKVTAIGRHIIRSGQEGALDEWFNKNKVVLRDFIGGENAISGGWRQDHGFEKIQNENGKSSEFVMFTSWPTVQKHSDLANSETFRSRWGDVQNFVTSADMKHASVLVSSKT